jgi:hypothetical protein
MGQPHRFNPRKKPIEIQNSKIAEPRNITKPPRKEQVCPENPHLWDGTDFKPGLDATKGLKARHVKAWAEASPTSEGPGRIQYNA